MRLVTKLGFTATALGLVVAANEDRLSANGCEDNECHWSLSCIDEVNETLDEIECYCNTYCGGEQFVYWWDPVEPFTTQPGAACTQSQCTCAGDCSCIVPN
jgi:hypothetical protein